MTRIFTGGCACRRIRYEIEAEPFAMVDCQCRQCQHDSGTGHSSYVNFAGVTVKIEGDAAKWDLVGDGGTVKRRAFCPSCGSPVYMTFPAMPEIFIVRAGSLDDPSQYKPQMVTWSSTGHPWDHVDPGVPKFETMPPR